MSKPKETPAHVQVAEAGFGDAVEAKGFKRVGKTHWRLDGDGIVWRVATTPGSAQIDQSFDIVQGIYVDGLDDLYAAIAGKRKSEPMGRTSAAVHSWIDLTSSIVGARRSELTEQHSRAHSIWRQKNWLGRLIAAEPRMPAHSTGSWTIPYAGKEAEYGEEQWITLASGPIDEVIAYTLDHWKSWMYPDVVKYRSATEICIDAWGAGTPAATTGNRIAFAAAKLIGDDIQIKSMARAKFDRAQQPVSFFRKENREHWTYWINPDEWSRRRRDGYFRRTRNEWAIVRKREAIRACKWLLEWSDALDLGLDDPGIDWGFLERHEGL